MYFETVLRMNIRASRKEGKYIRALMVVDLAGLSFSTLCACLTPLLCYPCYPCCCPHVDTGCFLCLAFLPSLSRRALGFHLCSRFLPPSFSEPSPLYTGSMRTSCAEWPPLPPPTSRSSAARSSSSTPRASLSKAGTSSSEQAICTGTHQLSIPELFSFVFAVPLKRK